MKTVVLGPSPAEVQALIDRRRALGIDTFDQAPDDETYAKSSFCAGHGVDEILVVDPSAAQ